MREQKPRARPLPLPAQEMLASSVEDLRCRGGFCGSPSRGCGGTNKSSDCQFPPDLDLDAVWFKPRVGARFTIVAPLKVRNI